METPSWESVQTTCPACGARVSGAATSCAVCGAATGGGQQEHREPTIEFGAPSEGWGPPPAEPEGARPAERFRTFEDVPANRYPPPPTTTACDRCGALLELGARFCSGCGAKVDTQRLASRTAPEAVADEPPVAGAPWPDEEAEPEDAPAEDVAPEPESVEDELDITYERDIEHAEPEPYRVVEPVDELDATEEELLREARRLSAVAPFHEPVPVVEPDDEPEVAAAPEPTRGRLREIADTVVARKPRPTTPLGDALAAFGWVPVVAAGFALFALLIALLVHVFAPSSVAGYSPAELDLKVQMRAVEWLLAGILVALVGVIARR